MSVKKSLRTYHGVFAVWAFSSLDNGLESLGRVPVADGVNASIVDGLCHHDRISVTDAQKKIVGSAAYQESERRKADYQAQCSRCHPVHDDCKLTQ